MLHGSCLCGKVAYRITGRPQLMYYCHCGMCRKASGSTFATNILVREADLVIERGQSAVKAFESSPGEHRHFCSECGSPLYSRASARPGVVSIRCGTLDEDPSIRPSQHIYVDSKAPWFDIADGIPRFEREPE